MGRKLALLIANSVYDDTNLSRLVTPEADVDALAKVLRDPAIGGFDEIDTVKNESTRTIMVAIARFFAKKKRDELLLLYFSGHGILDSRGDLYLAARDTDHELINATAIPSSFINDRMIESSSKQKVLILDCCYSGAFTRGTKGQAGKAVHTANRFNGRGQVVMTATDATQYAWEGDAVVGEAQSSVFTRHLVQGLETGEADSDNDGWITLDEWYNYVYEQVIKETSKQTPSKWANQQGSLLPIAKSRLPILNPADVNLNVLVLREMEDFPSSETPRREAFKRLVVSLQQSQLVNKLEEAEKPYYIGELDLLMEYMPGGSLGSYNINTIFLDPLPSPNTNGLVPNRLEEITKFIFDVRAKHPGVVFVFYVDFNELEDQKEHFYAGERSRFAHYYKLDRKLVGQEFDAAMANILRECRDYIAYKRKTFYEYDVALSFAVEDRNYANALAEALSSRELKVFYDSYEKAQLWGTNLYSHFSEIYQNKAHYCVMFLSQHYAAKLWTNQERVAAQALAFSEKKEFILPVRLDNTEIPGILPNIAYLSWPPETAETIAVAIMEKLGRTSSKS